MDGFFIDAKTIGSNIKKRREELDITQDELAVRIDSGGKAYISKLEHGKSSLKVDTLMRLAEALECEPDYLLGRIKYPSRQVSDIAEKLPLSREAIEQLIQLHELIVEKKPLAYADTYSTYSEVRSRLLAGLIDSFITGILLARNVWGVDGTQLLEKVGSMDEAIRFYYYRLENAKGHYHYVLDEQSRMAIEGARYELGREFGLLAEEFMMQLYKHRLELPEWLK